MSKFKIGDKVKILSTITVDFIGNHGVKVGMIGTVVAVDEIGATVKHPNFKWGLWSFNDRDLELVSVRYHKSMCKEVVGKFVRALRNCRKH